MRYTAATQYNRNARKQEQNPDHRARRTNTCGRLSSVTDRHSTHAIDIAYLIILWIYVLYLITAPDNSDFVRL